MLKTLCTKHVKDEFWRGDYENNTTLIVDTKTDRFLLVQEPYHDALLDREFMEKEFFFAAALAVSEPFYSKMTRRFFDVYHETQKKMDKMKQKLSSAKSNIVPRTISKSRQHMFVLLNTHETDHPYYAMRTQKGNYKAAFKKLQIKYPRVEHVYDMYSPNGINFFIRLHKLKSIHVYHNSIQLLDDYTEEEFIHDIKKLATKYM